MKTTRVAALLVCCLILWPAAAVAADRGVVVYGVGNCFIIKTKKGHTLFERSGGGAPKVDQRVKGELSDFGYHQLYDTKGKELLVGFVQNFGVKKESELASFRKTCR